MEVKFTAGEEVRAAIARIGRTEDVQFSPGGGRLAVAGFSENRLLILGVEMNWDSEPPAIALTGPLELESDDLALPHGLCWIDERTLIVANREGLVVIFELPEKAASGKIRLSPVRIVGDEATDLIKTPGSVSAAPVGLDLVELFVCNNYVGYVSRHLVDRRNAYAPVVSEMAIRDGLDIPDGVMISPSGRWIAVSNHGHARVVIYRNDSELGPASRPQAVLKGVNYPHGVRFAADERTVLVADAGTPFVHLYRSDGVWDGEHEPDASIRVISDDSFTRGGYNRYEGGPKGLDVTRDGRLMVISCHEEPFAFFDMRSALSQGAVAKPVDRAESESARETLLRYLASEQSRVEEATMAIRLACKHDIGLVMNSPSYRITAPLRWARSTLRKADPRRIRRSRRMAEAAIRDAE